MIPFETIKKRYRIEDVAKAWLECSMRGGELYAKCPFHDDRVPSMHIHAGKQFFYCFSCCVGGDVIQLVQEMNHCSASVAARILDGSEFQTERQYSKVKEPAIDIWKYAVPVAGSAPNFKINTWGDPVRTWCWHRINGDVAGYTARYENDGEKIVLPWSYGHDGEKASNRWRMKQFKRPLPLLNTLAIVENWEHPIWVCEGEKAADACHILLEGKGVATTWPGGTPHAMRADWKILKGKTVVLWPDADEAGRAAMAAIGKELVSFGCDVSIVDTNGLREKFDAADIPFGSNMFDLDIKTRTQKFLIAPTTTADAKAVPQELEILPPEVRPVNIFNDDPHVACNPGEQLPPHVAEWVIEQAKVMGCDQNILQMGALVAFAAVTSDHIQIQCRRNDPQWKESARLWGAVIGQPSARKTPSLSRVLEPLRRIDASLRDDYIAALDREKQKKRDEQDRVPDARILVQDTTIEALSQILMDNDRGILVFNDELASWIGSIDRYSGNGPVSRERSHWLEAYNGEKGRRIDRISRGPVFVPNWSCCILGGIQPESMQKAVKNMNISDDGFLQRFQFCYARPASMGEDRLIPERITTGYREAIEKVWKKNPKIKHPTVLAFSEEAREIVDSTFAEVQEILDTEGFEAPILSHAGKMSGLFVRVCLVLHMMQWGYGREDYTIQAGTAAKARSLIFDWLWPSAVGFYMSLSENALGLAEARAVARWILSSGRKEFKRRDVVMNNKDAFGSLTRERQDHVLRQLMDFHWIFEKQKAFVVNQAVYEDFSEQKARELRKRQTFREHMARLRGGERVPPVSIS